MSERKAIGPDAARVAAFDFAMTSARARLAAREPQQALAHGNTGRANVSAFAPMAVPADLLGLLDAGSEPR